MKRAWLGIALLAASWLFGLPYYHAENWTAWAVLLVLGTLAIAGPAARLPGRGAAFAVVMLLVPAAWLMPWPYRAAPLLAAAGAAITLLPILGRWLKGLAAGAAAAGAVLLAQGLAIEAYASLTARSHDLPAPLVRLVGGVAQLLGVDSAVDGGEVALFTMRQVHRLAATWELFLDPVTLCFLVGGIVLLALAAWSSLPQGKRAAAFARSAGALALVVALWLPLRTAIEMGLYLHRALRTEYDVPLGLMNQFWSPWLHLALAAGAALAAWRFVRLPRADVAAAPVASEAPPAARRWAAVALALAAGAVLAWAAFWDPVGERKAGRILVDEGHSRWERTDRPFDTNWYGHLAGYNYYCIYDYLSRFHDMGRLTEPVSDETLAACDVLVVKVPTLRYAPEEVAAIGRFVERGGGLLLIGEHTNVFGTGEYLNDIARQFGFRYRYDCLFGIDSFFEDTLPRAWVPHPILQHVPEMEFAVSCSIEPTGSGRAVVLGTGLKNLGPDYHATNFYPQAEDRADMRYGAFVQVWSTRAGRGRVVAFTDSTIFSNFCAFEPGKSELMLGMIEWLNRRDSWGDPRIALAAVGAALLAAAAAMARRWGGAWIVLVAALLLGGTMGAAGVRAANRASVPPPQAVRPFVRVVMDRTVSDAVLGKGGFVGGLPEGFGIFEQWILRLGYFTARRAGDEAFTGDLLVVVHPRRAAPPGFREGLVRYVEEGGKVLVLDSADNAGSTANDLLAPFGLAVSATAGESGPLVVPAGWPSTTVQAAREVTGGSPLVRIGGKAVAAVARRGKGTVTAVGFASRFNDLEMGVTTDMVPREPMRQAYELEYTLIGGIIEDRLPALSPGP
ncbi:MAG: hypothetical protein NTY65_08180 [Planctomycetota bacterium]|nr:hypothetical protein [Planctomycetota bacterium]